jgi:hypothetical protein
MSENLDLARSSCTAYERGDPLARLDRADPDMEYVVVGPSRPRWRARCGPRPGDVADVAGALGLGPARRHLGLFRPLPLRAVRRWL